MNIANIHAVRDSLYSLRAAYAGAIDSVAVWPVEDLLMLPPRLPKGMQALAEKLKDHSWFKHLASIISGAVELVIRMRLQNQSVFVHCSDGWDRTAQVCLRLSA